MFETVTEQTQLKSRAMNFLTESKMVGGKFKNRARASLTGVGTPLQYCRYFHPFGQSFQAQGVILGVCGAEPGVGLDDADGSFPNQLIV